MPECQHPISTMRQQPGDAFGDLIFSCTCGKQLLLDRDILLSDEAGWSKRSMLFVAARNAAGAPGLTVAGLHAA